MSAWDDDGSEEDEFDLIETPPTVHSVTVNSSGTRIAVAHSKGATIYSLFAASPPGASPPPADQPKPFAPKILLKLDHRHLCTASGLPERAASNGASSDDDNEAGRRAAGRTSGTADSARSAAPSTTGVGMVALLYETNVLALVGGGEAPCQPPNRVLLFNGEYEQQRITLLGPVAQVILRNRRVIALAQTMLTVHSFTGEKLLEAPATGWAVATPVGRSSMATWSAAALGAALAHMSAPSAARSKSDEAVPTLRRMPIDATNVDTNAICAFPDSRQGGVSFCNWLTPSLHTLRIVAHQGDIDGIALTPNGEGLITASDTNTVIRVWTVATGAKLRELRLGSQPHATFVRSLGLYSLYGERPSPQPSSFCPDFAVVVDSRGEVKFFYVGGSSPNDSTQSSEVAMAPTPGGGNSPHPAPTPAPSSASGSSTAELAGKNQASRLSTFQFMSSYFASEWHCTSLTLPHLSITSGSSPGQSKSSADAAVMPSVMPITGLGWFEITTAAPPLLPSGARAGAGGNLASAVKPVTANNAPQQMLIHVLCVSAVNGVVSRVQFNASTGKCTLMGSQQFE